LERLHAFGAALLALSIPFTAAAFTILESVPLTALGIGFVILSISILLTPAQTIPPHAVRAMMEGSVLSLEAILEEFDISEKGYYIRSPSGRIYVYVPIAGDPGPPSGEPEPSALIYKERGSEYLVLVPPASELAKSPEISGMDFESALTYVLVDLMEAADSMEVVANGFISVKLRNVKSHISAGRFKAVFGSLEASIAACLAANLLGPTRIADELEEGDDKIIILEVFGR